jgi:uncharacterized protein
MAGVSSRQLDRHDEVLARLGDWFAARHSVLIAFSGGVDSALVAGLAFRALGSRALAVTAAAETMAGRELETARRVAAEIGIHHQVVTYSELDQPEFVANPAWRCYVCQGLRMSTMVRLASELGMAAVCDGTNASDPGPDRPGLAAVRENGVLSPLLDHGIDKAGVRELARRLGLSVAERPANACLSSRIPHGQAVTEQALRRVERAEDLLHRHGFELVRVRHLTVDRARVEVAPMEVERLRSLWPEVEPGLRRCGFGRVEIDPLGYRVKAESLLPVVTR